MNTPHLKGEELYRAVQMKYPSFTWSTDESGKVRFSGYPLRPKKKLLRQLPLRQLLEDTSLDGVLITDPIRIAAIRAESAERRRAAKNAGRSHHSYE